MTAENQTDNLVAPMIGNPSRVLIAGSRVYGAKIDRRTLFPKSDVVGVDMQSGHGVDFVADLEFSIGLPGFDHIDCCSMLEHCRRPWLVAANLEKALNPGGSILLSVPFVWRVHAYPSDYWRITKEALPILFPSITWELNVYMANGQISTKPRAIMHDGKRFMERAQVVAFGFKKRS